ncbi:NACHT domain-containing protein [Streptomyces phaeochromogenes]|uniref:NACHT domain-containing protein n=1 Tax=Streptomyces phaeochromogenes TaxID=1923 RepID=A0ABZ1HUQ5_STRPH|nr:NACHT domain-containing protein [Streptomyces phaeochromogenes]WSD20980.1 NACHT domain-containing protein [Streptomyces phaeochromogenes]
MTEVRGTVRILAGAALTVFVGVAVNQILSEGKFSWTWLYISLGIAVLLFLYSEAFAAPGSGAASAIAPGRRRVYLRQLRASVRNMETVGVATPGQFVLRMRQVYVDVSLVPQALHTAAGEPYLGAVSGSEPVAGPGERRSLESVLRDAERDRVARVLAVVGGPGSGKTTLARNTALSLSGHRRGLHKPMLPVLLYLRDHAAALLADEPPGLEEVAVSAGWLEGKVSASWIERQLDGGGCVVLLDGLDEVAKPTDRTRVVSWIGRQIQRHPRNVYVVTSRPHGYEANPLPGAEVLQVRRFTAEQISRFLHQWSYATERRAREGTEHEVRAVARRTAEDLLVRIRDQPALYDLAANPLLLTMTANVHRYRGQLPGSRAELYAEMCDVLLHRRSEARGMRDATGLSGPHKQHIVQHLALAMMKARTRDCSVSDAATAIQHPLQEVPGDVAPETFLEEARKSGLLVEREHGTYGFAHLTLQEYLAAAQLGTPHADTRLLTTNVHDPWWRETILLWAAGNDATAIITACLNLDTVAALALAFDCADQARTVAPDTRSLLDSVLEPVGPGQNSTRRRLLAGIQATRTLRETIPLSDTTALCARPIPANLYHQFIQEELAEGRHYPYTARPTRTPEGSSPAMGMYAQDAERFIDWLNNITSDTAYRLPTPAELSDPAAAMATDLTLHIVWANDGTRTIPHQPSGAPWRFTFPVGGPQPTPATDRKDLSAYLWFLTTPPAQRVRVEIRARGIAAALKHPPAFRSDSSLAPLELVLHLTVAFHLVRLGTLDVSRYELDRDSYRLHRLAGALSNDQILDLDARYEVQLEHTLRAALHTAREVRGRDHRLDSVLDDVSHAHTATVSANNFNVPADRRRDALAVPLARALAHVLDARYTLDLDQGLDLGLNRDRGVTPLIARHSRDRALVHALDLELGRHLSLGPPDIDQAAGDADREHEAELFLSLDRALDLALGSQNRAQTAALAAFVPLLNIWNPTANEETSLLDDFDDLLKRAGATSPAAEQWAPGDPITTLRRAQSLLQVGRTGPAPPLFDQAQHLVDRALELVTAMRDRRLPSDAHVLACIRTAVLVAAEVLRQLRRSGQASGAEDLLLMTWRHLISPMPSNQVMLVIRTHQ